MKVAIAGYGVEGEASYKYWSSHGAEVTIVDENPQPGRPIPKGAKVLLGENVFQHLSDYDVVVRTAGLPPSSITTKGKIWSATNEFFAHCPAPIIGVTGSKGKGTISSLIASILQSAGKKVHLVGNIGQAALEILPEIEDEDIVIYELSSFQLWDIERSPSVAVVGMIEPDHLDIHADFADYVEAKSNIRRFQRAGDICFYHPTNKYSAKIAKSSFDGERHRYACREDKTVYVRNDGFYVENHMICPLSALQLPGKHNVENACAAISAARLFVADELAIERGLKSFTGLDHRLKFVAEVDDVRFYNDSIATTPGSAIAAIKAFKAPKIMILGGSEKGADYTQLIKQVTEDDVRGVIVMGKTGQVISDKLKQKDPKGSIILESVDSMVGAVAAAKRHAKAGDVVVLSPASASFDQYKNYADRGEQFIKAVKDL